MRSLLRFFGAIGRFLLHYLICLVFHWEGLIPAVILLVLHFWPGIPLFWFFIALGLWLLFVLIRMLFFRFAIRSSADPTPFRENKNPYSFRPYRRTSAPSGSEGNRREPENRLSDSGRSDANPSASVKTDSEIGRHLRSKRKNKT